MGSSNYCYIRKKQIKKRLIQKKKKKKLKNVKKKKKKKKNENMRKKMKSFHLQTSGTGGGALLQSLSKGK